VWKYADIKYTLKMNKDEVENEKLVISLDMKEELAGEGAPVDTNNIAYTIFLLFGIGALLPWNAVLSAMPFF
jgi:hypothetical protein